VKQLLTKTHTVYGLSSKLGATALVIPALLLALGALSAAAEDNGCSNATLKGDYASAIQGDQPNPDGTQSPVKGVAIAHFDGTGKLTQRDFLVTGGVLSPGQGDAASGFQFTTGETGKYNLSPDCTGSAEIDLNAPVPPGSGLSPGVIKLMIVVNKHGNTIHAVVAEITPPFATAPSLNTTSSEFWKIDRDCEHDHE
jgi:hypothetical protein